MSPTVSGDNLGQKARQNLHTKQLRLYAIRLMAFALKALEEGDRDFAKRLLARASECLDGAQSMETSQQKESALGSAPGASIL
jgi:phage shock protein A